MCFAGDQRGPRHSLSQAAQTLRQLVSVEKRDQWRDFVHKCIVAAIISGFMATIITIIKSLKQHGSKDADIRQRVANTGAGLDEAAGVAEDAGVSGGTVEILQRGRGGG